MQDCKDHIKRQLFNRLMDPMLKVIMPANSGVSWNVRSRVIRRVFDRSAIVKGVLNQVDVRVRLKSEQ